MHESKSIKFSIITCTKNSEQYLEKTISSVRSQSYTNYEHIFIDGHSVDGTKRIIESQKEKNFIIYSRDSKGIANAMNEGIKVATGDIILHLHSDDYLAHADVLSRVARYFSSNVCHWLYGRTLLDNNAGWTPEAPIFQPYSYKRLLQGNIIPHPATFVRRSLYQKFGLFDESLKYAMDYDMWLRLAKETPPLQYPEFFSVFRFHENSATFSNRMASFIEDHAVRRRYSSFGDINSLINELRFLRKKHQLQRVIGVAGVKNI